MKQRVSVLLTAAAILCLVGTFAFAAGGQEVTAEKVIIKFPSHQPTTTYLGQAETKFIEAVQEESGGRIEVRHFPGGQAGNARENIESVTLGTADMTFCAPAELSNWVPRLGVMDCPYMFDDFDHVEACVDGKVGDLIEKDVIEKVGLRILGWWHVGFRDMLTIDKPIRSLADFKGVKFRSPEVPVYVMMFNAIGATPTPIAWGEVYSAMKTGIVDGMETTPEGMVANNLYELAKYVILTRHINTQGLLVMNEKFYQGLPKDLQRAVDSAMAQTIPWQREMIIKASEDAYKTMTDSGLELIEIDQAELRRACAPVWDELVGGAEGAQELIDLIDSYR